MKDYLSIDIRPYQLLCLICLQGRKNETETYYHEERLKNILLVLQANPILPLTLRCTTDTVYRYQNPGREYNTPESEMYNDLRDLTVLQRLGAAPGDTRPAIDLLNSIPEAIPSCLDVCAYSEEKAPGWPRCRFADTGNYERGLAMGVDLIVTRRTPDEKERVKKESADDCYKVERLRIRPHHLLCLTCFHGGRTRETLAPIQEDNLYECIDVMQRNPEIPVELIHGPCMICPPCSAYHTSANLCIGGISMGLRDDKKDLDLLRRLGLHYGDVLPARELLQRLYSVIKTTTEICGYGDGIEHGREWRVCGGPTGNEAFVRAREVGLGVSGVAVPPDILSLRLK